MFDDLQRRDDARSALLAEFEGEIARMVDAAICESPVEAVMRIRALAEIAELLSTESLLLLVRDLSDLSSALPAEPVSNRYRQSGCALGPLKIQ